MDCEDIKNVIPKYFNHTASEDEIKTVEEHLCVCHDCRSTLGELMDRLAVPEEAKPEGSPSQEEISSPAEEITPIPEAVESQAMEYIPGEEVAEDISAKPKEETPEELPQEPPQVPEPVSEPEPEPIAELESTEPEKEPESLPEEKEELQPSLEPELPKAEVSEEIETPAPESLEELPEPQPEPEERLESQVNKQEYPLDDVPLERNKAGIFEYACLAVGIIIFGALLYLRLRG